MPTILEAMRNVMARHRRVREEADVVNRRMQTVEDGRLSVNTQRLNFMVYSASDIISDVRDIGGDSMPSTLTPEQETIDKVRESVLNGSINGATRMRYEDHYCRDVANCVRVRRAPVTDICNLRNTRMEETRTDNLVESLDEYIHDMTTSVNNDVDLRIVTSLALLQSLRMRGSILYYQGSYGGPIDMLYSNIPITTSRSMASNVTYLYCNDRFIDSGRTDEDFARRIIVNQR